MTDRLTTSGAESAGETPAPWAQQRASTRSATLEPPRPEPNTAIDPQRGEPVCAEAIASHRATSSQTSASGQRAEAPHGVLAPDQIRRTTLQNLGQIADCHREWLAVEPAFEGRLVVRYVIGGDGAVIAATIRESSTDSVFLRQCVVNVVRRWRFDAPQGGGVVTVNYPFNMLRPLES
jgi:TonB family protein